MTLGKNGESNTRYFEISVRAPSRKYGLWLKGDNPEGDIKTEAVDRGLIPSEDFEYIYKVQELSEEEYLNGVEIGTETPNCGDGSLADYIREKGRRK